MLWFVNMYIRCTSLCDILVCWCENVIMLWLVNTWSTQVIVMNNFEWRTWFWLLYITHAHTMHPNMLLSLQHAELDELNGAIFITNMIIYHWSSFHIHTLLSKLFHRLYQFWMVSGIRIQKFLLMTMIEEYHERLTLVWN